MPRKDHPESKDNRTWYTYKSLASQPDDTIRLLTVEPNASSYSLSAIRLKDNPRFKALSYTWGEQKATKKILIENKMFLVRTNLWAFLQRLQKQPESTRIWIDALCINQEDLDERSSQVGMMKNIFCQADEVVAWLGEDTTGVAEVLAEHYANDLYESSGIGHSPIEQHDADFDIWTAMSNLAARGYWKRTWVVQELVLAQNVVLLFGPEGRLGLSEFAEWYNFAEEHNMSTMSNTNLQEILGRRSSDPDTSRNSLAALVDAFADTKCTDPRDKVYALLSLTQDNSHGIEPDYTKTAADLYFDIRQARLGNAAFEMRLRTSLRLEEVELRSSSRYSSFGTGQINAVDMRKVPSRRNVRTPEKKPRKDWFSAAFDGDE